MGRQKTGRGGFPRRGPLNAYRPFMVTGLGSRVWRSPRKSLSQKASWIYVGEMLPPPLLYEPTNCGLSFPNHPPQKRSSALAPARLSHYTVKWKQKLFGKLKREASSCGLAVSISYVSSSRDWRTIICDESLPHSAKRAPSCPVITIRCFCFGMQ